MDKVTPRILSGFMELLPADQLLFNQMFDQIRRVYELYGFTPIETPAIELTDILFAKGGGETEKQIYRIEGHDNNLALHFDLTVPLARYVAQYAGQLVFPFRRYQMQKVWRGERAQRGRFREFYQCDIDVIGANDPVADAEIPSVIYAVFKALGFDRFTIRINNRKILGGLFESLGLSGQFVEILRAIDKVDKIGEAEVIKELQDQGVAAKAASQIMEFVKIQGTNADILKLLRDQPVESALYKSGVEELTSVVDLIGSMGVPEANVRVDLTIARGLDYYTGTVYETVLDDYPQVGSVCSGGRYDDLAGYYTDIDLPGVGVSIGLTRLFYQLKEAGVIQARAATPSQVLVAKTDQSLLKPALELATALRETGIATEVYLEPHKVGKQFKYAGRLGIPLVVVIGQKEIDAGTVTLRDLATSQQRDVPVADLVAEVQKSLS